MAAPAPIGVITEKVQKIWSALELQVSPFCQVPVLPGITFRELDATAKKFIAGKFMYVPSPPLPSECILI